MSTPGTFSAAPLEGGGAVQVAPGDFCISPLPTLGQNRAAIQTVSMCSLRVLILGTVPSGTYASSSVDFEFTGTKIGSVQAHHVAVGMTQECPGFYLSQLIMGTINT